MPVMVVASPTSIVRHSRRRGSDQSSTTGDLWFAMFAEGPIKGSEVVTLRELIQPRVDSNGQFRRYTVQTHEYKTKVIHTHATQQPYGCQDFGLGWTTIAWHARPGAQPLLLSPPLHLNQTCCN